MTTAATCVWQSVHMKTYMNTLHTYVKQASCMRVCWDVYGAHTYARVHTSTCVYKYIIQQLLLSGAACAEVSMHAYTQGWNVT